MYANLPEKWKEDLSKEKDDSLPDQTQSNPSPKKKHKQSVQGVPKKLWLFDLKKVISWNDYIYTIYFYIF